MGLFTSALTLVTLTRKYRERDRYHIKSLEEISAELCGVKRFNLIDAKCGYLEVKPNGESSFLTAFNTPWGKYQFLHLPFRLKVSSDVFQEQLDVILKQSTGVTGILKQPQE